LSAAFRSLVQVSRLVLHLYLPDNPGDGGSLYFAHGGLGDYGGSSGIAMSIPTSRLHILKPSI